MDHLTRRHCRVLVRRHGALQTFRTLARLQTNAEAVGVLGTPITSGSPTGSIQTSGPSGRAELAFSVEGPKGRGTVYLRATKDFGVWKIDRIELQIEGRSGRINLGEGDRVRLERGSPPRLAATTLL